MKKIIFTALALTAIFASCEDKNKYTLTGKIPGNESEGKTVYLLSSDKMSVLDSAKVTNGVFKIERQAADTPIVRFIQIEVSEDPAMFIEEKGKMFMSLDSTVHVYLVKGTRLNDEYTEYKKALAGMYIGSSDVKDKWKEVESKGGMNLEKFKEQQAEEKALADKIENHISDYIKKNIDNEIGENVLYTDTYFMNPDKLEGLLAMMPAIVKEDVRYSKIEQKVMLQQATSEGKLFVDIRGFDLGGKEVALSDYAGKDKVVLLDFWASWCKPCRRVMPEFVSLYNEYKDKGFTIVGVSLDEDKDEWVQATKDDGIEWPQFSNLQGWKEPSSQTYGVRSIPNTVLIDKNGVIAARNLHGYALKYKIEELIRQ